MKRAWVQLAILAFLIAGSAYATPGAAASGGDSSQGFTLYQIPPGAGMPVEVGVTTLGIGVKSKDSREAQAVFEMRVRNHADEDATLPVAEFRARDATGHRSGAPVVKERGQALASPVVLAPGGERTLVLAFDLPGVTAGGGPPSVWLEWSATVHDIATSEETAFVPRVASEADAPAQADNASPAPSDSCPSCGACDSGDCSSTSVVYVYGGPWWSWWWYEPVVVAPPYYYYYGRPWWAFDDDDHHRHGDWDGDRHGGDRDGDHHHGGDWNGDHHGDRDGNDPPRGHVTARPASRSAWSAGPSARVQSRGYAMGGSRYRSAKFRGHAMAARPRALPPAAVQKDEARKQ